MVGWVSYPVGCSPNHTSENKLKRQEDTSVRACLPILRPENKLIFQRTTSVYWSEDKPQVGYISELVVEHQTTRTCDSRIYMSPLMKYTNVNHRPSSEHTERTERDGPHRIQFGF
jgi:hypothetical protein